MVTSETSQIILENQQYMDNMIQAFTKGCSQLREKPDEQSRYDSVYKVLNDFYELGQSPTLQYASRETKLLEHFIKAASELHPLDAKQP